MSDNDDASTADELLQDAGKDPGDLDLSAIDLGGLDLDSRDLSGGTAVAAGSSRPKMRGRLAGLIALVLGVAGLLASLIVAFLVLRTGFTATSTVDNLLRPVAETVDRVETRIDQADDAVNRDGVEPELMPELRARSEGLSDVSSTAEDLFLAVQDHPVYKWLPADLDPLGTSLADFADGATTIEQTVSGAADGRALNAADSAVVADELNALQAGVDTAEDALESTTRSLKRWIRLGALAGFLGSLWSMWAQFCLARRGARSLRGRPV